MVVIGDFSIGGTIMKVENLASTLQVCLDSGAKKSTASNNFIC